MKRHGGWKSVGVEWLAAAIVVAASNASATEYFGPERRGEIQARMSTQNTFQHDTFNTIDWVQWRNELRFDLKYDLIPRGENWGPFSQLNFNLLYRGRVDPVFLLRDQYEKRGYDDRQDVVSPEGRIPRELFLDVGFTGALSPLSLRIGRQQVVWGEADLFRSIDVVNPLDLSENGFVGEDFADFREPLWIAKALYDIGKLGPVGEAGLEVFYSPNSRPQLDRPWLLFGETWRLHTSQHNVLTGFERNLVLPFQAVRHPWELGRVGARNTDSPAVVQNADGSFSDFMYQLNNNTPSSEFDARDASMVGVRFLGTTFANAYFTINYLFKRSDSVGSSVVFEDLFDPTAPGTGTLRADILGDAIASAFGTTDTDGNGIPEGVEDQIRDCLAKRRPVLMIDDANPATSWDGSVYSDPRFPELHTGARNVSYKPVLPPAGDGLVHSTGCLTIPLWHPWTHILGFTLTYNDYDYTGFVWRVEQSYSTKEARNGAAPNSPHRLIQEARGGQLAVPQERDFATHNMRTTGAWRSMVGFDYLTSLSNWLPPGVRKYPNPWRSLLMDQWFFTSQFLNDYYTHARHNNLNTSFTNRYHHWNPLLTLAGTGFFVNQRFRPTLAMGWDLSEKPFPLFIIQGEYFVTPKLAVRVGELLYAGSKNNETNSGLHFYADRDTTFVRLTYFLL